MTIVYFALGEDMDMYCQAYLSILSFLKQTEPGDRVVVVTSNTDFFRHFDQVEAIAVDDSQVSQWKGKHNFFWRAKIKSIEMVSARYPDDDLLYLDCDTFLYGDLSEFKNRLGRGQGFMDGNEGHPSRIKYKPQRMYKCIAGHTYAGIIVSDRHDMWCAGVVGIPSDKKQCVVETALALCDGMLDDGSEPIVVEQYSLSIAMSEKVGLQSSKPYVAHYWGNKEEWIPLARKLFLQSFFCGAGREEEIRMFDRLPIKETPIRVKRHSTNRKLKNMVDRLFPDGEKWYL